MDYSKLDLDELIDASRGLSFPKEKRIPHASQDKPDQLIARANALKNREADNKKLKEDRVAYGLERNAIEDAIKAKIIDCYEDYPQVDECWDLAYQYGHSGGWHDVNSCFEDFSELLSK